ncbi:hypothetical protein HMPREF0454_02576 [Hafnia alvei ATCC 51873]|uniref:Uncharacterized protein n=1 Tax=Hafnia alvei ATCC 51873 TaxID=1002364 RepID=G9Y7Q2_HAFAL|nr:hypothetical protein HMPREF0454_02576 [Hafnia alvei ATCC 51873]
MKMPVIWAADLKGVLHYGHYKAPADKTVLSDVDDTDRARHILKLAIKMCFYGGE